MEFLKGVGSFFKPSCLGATRVDKGESDVFNDGESGDEIEILENDADALGAEAGFFARGEFGGGLAIKEVGAGGGFIEEAEDI